MGKVHPHSFGIDMATKSEADPTYEMVPVSKIEIGERRREDYGDIGLLAAGIKQIGLLHPLIVQRVNGGFKLVTGGRRLRAVQKLGWKTVSARMLERLTPEEARLIELEENENRKSFTARERRRTFDTAKQLVEDAKKAEGILAQLGPEKTGKRGQPKKPASTRAIAAAVGTTRQDIERAAQHVETATMFPFMQSWRQSEVLAVRETLEDLPEEERQDAMGVLGCAKILDGGSAAGLLRKIAAKKPDQRAALYQLSKSDDPRDKSRALSTAAELPPLPDPRLGCIDTALTALRRATQPYPRDPLTPELQTIIGTLKRARTKVEAVSFDARREAREGALQ